MQRFCPIQHADALKDSEEKEILWLSGSFNSCSPDFTFSLCHKVLRVDWSSHIVVTVCSLQSQREDAISDSLKRPIPPGTHTRTHTHTHTHTPISFSAFETMRPHLLQGSEQLPQVSYQRKETWDPVVQRNTERCVRVCLSRGEIFALIWYLD